MTIFYDYVLDELRLKDVPDGSGGFWGSFYDTTTQTAASTTVAYPITLNTTAGSNGVAIGSPTSKVVFTYAGVYSITFSIQFENSSLDDHRITTWLRKNGTDITDSSSITSIPKSHGADNGAIITTINYVIELQAGDYLQTYWQTESTAVSITTIPAGTTPTTPLSPSIIFTAVQGGIIQGGSTTNSLASLTDVSFTSLASGQIIMSNASGNWSNLTFPTIPSIPSLGSLAVLNSLSYYALDSRLSLGSLAVQNNLSYYALDSRLSLGSLAVQDTVNYYNLVSYPSLGSLAVLNTLSYYALDSRLSLGSLAVQDTVNFYNLVSYPSLGSLSVLNSLSYYALDSRLSLGSLAVLDNLSYYALDSRLSLGSLAVQNNLSYFALDSRLSLGSLAVQNTVDYLTQITNLPSLGSLAQISNVVSPLVLSGATLSLSQASIVHNNLGGLTTGDPHTQYALLAGRSGGQSLYGGTVANDILFLRGTNANGNTATNNAIRFGVGNSGGTYVLDVRHNGTILQTANSTAAGSPDVIGANFNLTESGGGAKTIYSHRAKLTYAGVTSIDGVQATSNQIEITGGGTVNALEVLTSNLTVENSSTVVNAKLIRLFAPTVQTGGSIGTLIGLDIPALTQGTTNWSIYSDGGTMYHSGSIYTGSTGHLAVNQSNLTPVAAAGAADILCGNGNVNFQFDSSAASFYLEKSIGNGTGSDINFYKSRGATASPSITTVGDDIGLIRAFAYQASAYVETHRIVFETVTATNSGVIRMYTANAGTLGTDKFTIMNDGDVGIGVSAPAQKLDVNGRIRMATWTADGDTAAYRDTATNCIALVTSDIRLKKDLEVIPNALDKIKGLSGYTYRRIDDEENAKKKYGLIAQEVLAVAPELTFEFNNEDDPNTYYSVHYDKVPALLLQAIKEQQVIIESLKQDVEILKGQINGK